MSHRQAKHKGGREAEIMAVRSVEKVLAELLNRECTSTTRNEAEVSEGLTEPTLTLLASALDNSVDCRQLIWNSRVVLYEMLLNCVRRECLEVGESRTNGTRLHSCVRVIIKLEQHFHSNFILERKSAQDLTERIFKLLVQTLHTVHCPSDSALLAGTALAIFLHSLPDIETGCALFLSALEVEDFVDSATSDLCAKFTSLSVGDSSQREMQRVPARLIPGRPSNIFLLHGLFSCGKADIALTRVVSGSTCGSLALLSHCLLQKMCRDSSLNSYMTFQTMVAWLRFLRRNLEHICVATEPLHFDSNSAILQSLIELFDVNWENPIAGVTGLVWDAYELALEIHVAEADARGVPDLELTDRLLSRILAQPWTAKAKYPPLAILIPRLGTGRVLTACPSICLGMAESLASNPVAAAANMTYIALLRQLRRELQSPELEESWKEIFMEPLVRSLCDTSSTIRHNSIRHWLPATLKEMPPVFGVLLSELDRRGGANSLLAVGCILHHGRQRGICSLRQVDATLLRSCLGSQDEDTRIEVFAFLCHCHRKAEPLSATESDLLQEFLPLNLNVDNSAFRQHLASNIRVLLVRIRDSCLGLLKTAPNCEDLRLSMDFTNWLHDLLIRNVATGACYQRKQTCLQLLDHLLGVFSPASAAAARRKGAVPAETSALLAYFAGQGKCDFRSDRTRFLLLVNITDYMNEIQKLALSILSHHFASGSVSAADDSILLHYALQRCGSPKTMCSESGVVFCQLLLCRAEFPGKLALGGTLIRLLRGQLTTARSDMLTAAKTEPMHGLVAALSQFLSHCAPLCTDVDRAATFRPYVEESLTLADEVIAHVSAVLASKAAADSDEFSPSFSEIGEAIDDIVAASDGDEDVAVHQLVSACCWLSLKESVGLLGDASRSLPAERTCAAAVPHLLGHERMLSMGRTLVAVLTRCRHRGVIEACQVAFQTFCRVMLDPDVTDQGAADFVDSILRATLDGLAEVATKTSVTRKSAGLPALVLAVFAGECGRRKKNLGEVVRQLCRLLTTPLPASVSDATDLPQTHSLHILRALVHDAGLAQDMFFHLEEVTLACLDCFRSPLWSVRNAALQLFGAVVPRLVGQKKAFDDTSVHNTIAFAEFLGRWPNLSDQVYRLLDSGVECGAVPPFVLPILSLLGRVSPDVSSAVGSGETRRDPEDFVRLLRPYLGCPVFYMRKMTAKAILALTPSSRRQELLLEVLAATADAATGSSWNVVDGFSHLSLEIVRSFREPTPTPEFVSRIRSAFLLFVRLLHSAGVPPFTRLTMVEVLANLPAWLQLELDLDDDTVLPPWTPGLELLTRKITCLRLNRLPCTEAANLVVTDMLREKNSIDVQVEACLEFLESALDSNECAAPCWLPVLDGVARLLDICADGDSGQLHRCLQLILSVHGKLGVAPTASGALALTARKLILGTGGSSVVATGVAVWAVAISESKECLKDVDLDVFEWSELVVRHSNPRLAEPYRLMAARGVTICGATVFKSVIADGTEISIAEKILKGALVLLQDEHQEVRRQVAMFVASLYDAAAVHENLAIRMLGDYVVRRFADFKLVWNLFWGMLVDGRVIFASESFAECERGCSLFDQEEINVYAERSFMCGYYAALLKMMLGRTTPDARYEWCRARVDAVMTDAREVVGQLESWRKPGIGCLEVVCQTRLAPCLAGLFGRLDVLRGAFAENDSLTLTLTLLDDNLYELVGFNWRCDLPPHFDRQLHNKM